MTWLDDLQHVVRPAEPLAPHCWLGIGGAAEYFAEPTTIDELQSLVARCWQDERPVRLIGSGSNIIVSDHGVPGVVVALTAPVFSLTSVEVPRVRVGGGAVLGPFISTCVRDGLAGLEWLVGIPGTVGAALHGNAGDRTASIGSFLTECRVMTSSGEILRRVRDDMQFAYRESSLDELVLLDAVFELETEDRIELTHRMQKQWIARRAKEPTREKRAVHLFKDPASTMARELIEQAGLKGTTVGGAALFDLDPNFAVAQAHATSHDFLKLIDLVRDRVSHRMGIELEQAVQVW
jgi:UDP-N-acetylmuramate dehydrogenase